MSRYSEAEWVAMSGSSDYTGGPKRLVLHTTEGWSIASALGAYRAKNIAPQFTIDFVARRWLQHIDTARAASAMANLVGGVQTNRDGAVQIEIVGFAAYTQDISDDDLEWIGGIVRKICDREGINVNRFPRFVGQESGTIATATAPQRMSHAEWNDFDGVCGHQHVPENHHWDPGLFPYQRMLALTAPAANPTEEDEMKPEIVTYDGANQLWITQDWVTCRKISAEHAGGLVWLGRAQWNPDTNSAWVWNQSIIEGMNDVDQTEAPFSFWRRHDSAAVYKVAPGALFGIHVPSQVALEVDSWLMAVAGHDITVHLAGPDPKTLEWYDGIPIFESAVSAQEIADAIEDLPPTSGGSNGSPLTMDQTIEAVKVGVNTELGFLKSGQ